MSEVNDFYDLGRKIFEPKPRPCLGGCGEMYEDSTMTNRICPACREKGSNIPPILSRARINYKGLQDYLEDDQPKHI